MLPKSSLRAITSLERQALRHQWLRSGKCPRCFHESRRRARDDPSTNSLDADVPYNAPRRGPTRQQRAAMISEEVKMLQRDHPSPSFGEPDQDTLRPPGASQTVDPEATGDAAQEGRMGENDAVSREGPIAQGLAGTLRDDLNTSATENSGKTQSSVTQRTEAVGSATITENDLFEHYPNTIANSAFDSLINDRIKELAEPGLQDHYRHIPSLAVKMMRGHLVRLESAQEKAAVEAEAKRIAERLAQSYAQQKKLDAGAVQPEAKSFAFRPLPRSVKDSLVETMVKGRYDKDGLLERKAKHKQPVLNDIQRMTMMNATYLQDGNRLLKKVQSLLPSVSSTRQIKYGQRRA